MWTGQRGCRCRVDNNIIIIYSIIISVCRSVARVWSFSRSPRRVRISSPLEYFVLDRFVTARRRETNVFLRMFTFQSIKRLKAKLRGAHAFSRVPARKAIFFEMKKTFVRLLKTLAKLPVYTVHQGRAILSKMFKTLEYSWSKRIKSV